MGGVVEKLKELITTIQYESVSRFNLWKAQEQASKTPQCRKFFGQSQIRNSLFFFFASFIFFRTTLTGVKNSVIIEFFYLLLL